jgi:hypothetical protein
MLRARERVYPALEQWRNRPGGRKPDLHVYNERVLRVAVFVAVLAEMGVFAIARQSSPLSDSPVLQTGVITPKIICIAKPDQSYAVYLPSNYSADRKWPILYAFDPAARGVA